nr:PQQ-dependent sugar dehydrogenase [Flavilitoribacter sp.]
MSTLHYALLAVAFAGISAKVSAQLPAEFYDEKLPLNFSFPTGLVFDEDGRMYVWEKSGKVYIVDQEGQRLPDPLIDISEEVTNWKDHGLMGFALDPGFLINGNFYLYYAVDWHY